MTKVNLIDNGPLVVVGEHTITHPDGSQEVKPSSASYCSVKKARICHFVTELIKDSRQTLIN